MKKAWLVATATYRRSIHSTTFLLLTFGIPLLMVVAGGIAILAELKGAPSPIAYVDQTGQLANVQAVSVGQETVDVIRYPSMEEARAAVNGGEIEGYLVIPEGYLTAGTAATYYATQPPNSALEDALRTLVRQALLPGAPASELARIENPSRIVYIARQTGERVSQGPALVIRIGAPILIAFLFMLAVFATVSQMGTAVVREKDQRSMEMVITSISPLSLVSGKILGMTMLTVTQVGIWAAGAAIVVLALVLGASSVGQLSIPWAAIAWGALLGIPGYLTYAVVAAGLGIIAGDRQQARQLAGMLSFLGLAPLYFLGALINRLDSPLAVALTLFPLTAPSIGLIRLSLTHVPAWQFGAAAGILITTLAISVWFLARIFRAAMLIYGQALRPQEIWRAFVQG
jgi:ABC-2 type transport system permease protein